MFDEYASLCLLYLAQRSKYDWPISALYIAYVCVYMSEKLMVVNRMAGLRFVISVVCRKTNGEVNFNHEAQLW